MVNPALGPDYDLAQRLARLEGQVASLSTDVFASELALPVIPDYNATVGANGGVTFTTSRGGGQAFFGIFPLRHPYMAYVIWVAGAGTITLTAGPNSVQGILSNSSYSFNAGVGGYVPYYGGMYNVVGPSQSSPAFSLGGDPSQYGGAWGISISASVPAGGSITILPPMLFGRFTQ